MTIKGYIKYCRIYWYVGNDLRLCPAWGMSFHVRTTKQRINEWNSLTERSKGCMNTIILKMVHICTHNKRHYFGSILNGHVIVNKSGEMIGHHLEYINTYENVTLDKYVIMPNHIHAIISIKHNGTTRRSFPTVSEYIQRFKTMTTKLYIDGIKDGVYPSFEKAIWQKSFYDHIIRDENEYLRICKYIDENPLKWATDEYYSDIM